MNKKKRKQCAGYVYTYGDDDWSVTTDYINDNIYLSVPNDDADIKSIEEFGKAIIRAVADMKKDMKL